VAEEKVCVFQEPLGEEVVVEGRGSQCHDVVWETAILKVLENWGACSTKPSTVDLLGRMLLVAPEQWTWTSFLDAGRQEKAHSCIQRTACASSTFASEVDFVVVLALGSLRDWLVENCHPIP
jgi:hypothetical protein